MTPLADDVLLDMDALVKQSKLSRRTWRREIAAGRIGVVRIGGSVRIPKTELERYLALRYTPARLIAPGPVDVLEVLDKVLPKKHGRPRAGGVG